MQSIKGPSKSRSRTLLLNICAARKSSRMCESSSEVEIIPGGGGGKRQQRRRNDTDESKVTSNRQQGQSIDSVFVARPGQPKVFWMEGINPDIVREHWPSQGKLPYKKCELPPHISSMIPGRRRRRKRYGFGVARKMIVYERAHPEIRLVLLLGPCLRS